MNLSTKTGKFLSLCWVQASASIELSEGTIPDPRQTQTVTASPVQRPAAAAQTLISERR